MRKLLIGVPLLYLAACTGNRGDSVELTGKTVSKTFAASAFDRVSLEDSDNVVVRVGPAASVTAQGDSAIVDRLDVRVEDGELKIARKGKGNWFSSGGRKGNATVTVTVPQLAGASVEGSGNMTVDRVAGAEFQAAVAGSGDMRVGAIETRGLDAAVAGSGNLVLDRVATGPFKIAIAGSGNLSAQGTAEAADVSIAGSGDVEAASLVAARGKVAIAGSGNVALGVRGSAEVSILGSGDVDIHGAANCKTSKMGSGEVRCHAGAPGSTGPAAMRQGG